VGESRRVGECGASNHLPMADEQRSIAAGGQWPPAGSVPEAFASATSAQAATENLRLSDRQLRIRSCLREDAPVIAEIYEAGLRVVQSTDFPGKVYVLGHAIREIRNRLPDHMGYSSAERISYEGVEEVRGDWAVSVRPRLETTAPDLAGPDIPIPVRVVRRLDEFFKEHEGVKISREEVFVRFLASRDIAGAEGLYPRPSVRQWVDLRPEKFAHVRGRGEDQPSLEECLCIARGEVRQKR